MAAGDPTEREALLGNASGTNRYGYPSRSPSSHFQALVDSSAPLKSFKKSFAAVICVYLSAKMSNLYLPGWRKIGTIEST